MDHVAILRKAKIKEGDNLLEEIIAGRKTIESRWYVNKIPPWNKIKTGDKVYFKESGGPVKAKALVERVIQIENLNKNKIAEIVSRYGKSIAPNTSKNEWKKWINTQDKKRYCILIFLKDVKVTKPFEIDKTGFGSACAWLTTNNINKLRNHT